MTYRIINPKQIWKFESTTVEFLILILNNEDCLVIHYSPKNNNDRGLFSLSQIVPYRKMSIIEEIEKETENRSWTLIDE